MKVTASLLVFIAAITQTFALDNGLGRTPQMGWNSWDHYFCNINETIIRLQANAMVSLGLSKVGYNYVNVDDCWAYARDPNTSVIIADPTTFPSGMKALADYVHSLGLKFGIYSDAGYKTCAGRPGSLGYEKIDAETYASWGVDYLKYDNCNNDGTPPEVRYPVMRDALNATGRPIFYSMCEWGVDNPATWAMSVGNSWRTTGDITNTWVSVLSNLDLNDRWWNYSGPGGWNDPDMMEIGNGGLTLVQEQSHFSLWCLVKAPLIIGGNLLTISQEELEILMNTEAIAVNQDPLGKQGHKLVSNNGLEVWGGPLSGGAAAVILFNRNTVAANITANWSDLGLSPSASMQVRDLWAHSNVGTFTGSYTATVQPYGVVFVKLTPA